MTIGLCSVAGGGIGNIFDRVMYGSVTDFLYVRVGIFQTGIFNFADVSITAGVLLAPETASKDMIAKLSWVSDAIS